MFGLRNFHGLTVFSKWRLEFIAKILEKVTLNLTAANPANAVDVIDLDLSFKRWNCNN